MKSLQIPLARIAGKILFFVHVPKCGGTSVEAYLRSKGLLAFRLPQAIPWCRTTPQHAHASSCRELFPDGFADETFPILRDPVERLVSEYRMRKARREHIKPIDGWFREHVEAYRTRPFILDNYIRPQVQFLSEGTRVFRVEDGLEPVFDWIDSVTDGESADRDVWEMKARVPRPEVSDTLRELVADFYAEDLSVFCDLPEGRSVIYRQQGFRPPLDGDTIPLRRSPA